MEPILAFLAAPREGGNTAVIFLVQMLAIFAIFYFLLIRPQRKEQERHRQMVDSLKRGTEVITAGGIIGKVTDVKDDRITVQSGDSSVVVERTKVARVMDGGSGAAASAPREEEAPSPDRSGAGRGGKRGGRR